MPTSDEREKLQQYVDYLNEICNGLFTDSRLTVLEGSQPNYHLITRYQDGQIKPLELKPRSWLHFLQTVSIQEDKIIVQDYVYRYSLSFNPDDEDQWIFRYEYRLEPRDKYPHSHLHLNADMGRESLKHIHFPTGRVSIEQIIAFLITEYEVQPKKTDWFDRLFASHREFQRLRTDPPQFP